jgi:hypothetical protein
MSRFAFDYNEVNTMWKKLLPAIFFVLFLSSLGHAAEQRYSIPIDKTPILGPKNAQITIIEFLDFQ